MSSDSLAEDFARIRWTVIDYTPTVCSLPTATTAATTTDSNIFEKAEKRAIMLKRLLKPMYEHEARVRCMLSSGGYGMPIGECPNEVDSYVYVDMADHTMWLAVSEPMLLDDFYKVAVSDDLQSSICAGGVLDKDPSYGLVLLGELKRTLVSWWCK